MEIYIVLIISILLFLSSLFLFKHTHKINKEIDNRNELLEYKNKQLYDDYKEIINKIKNKYKELESTKERIKDKQKQFEDIQNNISKTTEAQIELSREAFKNYCGILENKYKEVEKEYDMEIDTLQTAYSNLQLKLLREADECREDLDKIRATRAAAIEAQRKEEEIKRNISSYCIIPSKNDLEDIKKLEKIKIDLHNPVILSKLIWSTYYQKEMTKFCNNMLGTDTVCGIYKITNQINGKCYIGQSVNIASRFKDHMKGGLGVNGPTGNKLYKAMREDGVWNFSWEVLEKCSREQLNEKERFYIDFYQSKEFGYNTQSGNKKGS